VFVLNVLECTVILIPTAVSRAPLVNVEELEPHVMEILLTATTEYAPSVRPLLSANPARPAPTANVLLALKQAAPTPLHQHQALQLTLLPLWLSFLYWLSC